MKVELTVSEGCGVQLDTTEKIATYAELLELVTAYLDGMGTVYISDTLPETGTSGVLYVNTATKEIYTYDDDGYTLICSSSDVEVATDEEVTEMLDEVFETE